MFFKNGFFPMYIEMEKNNFSKKHRGMVEM